MIKKALKKIIEEAVAKAYPGIAVTFSLEMPQQEAHGDFATNVALVIAGQVKKKPREVAEAIRGALTDNEGLMDSCESAGPGFLNFCIKTSRWIEALREIRLKEDDFGVVKDDCQRKAIVEFVSANPTGPLHVGNARGGPLGDAIANLLSRSGYEVTREFYINDVGGQIDKLGESILAEQQKKSPGEYVPGKDAMGEYRGDYVTELAETARKRNIPSTACDLGRFGIAQMMEEIRQDCEDMGISFDSWKSEKEILESGATQQSIEALRKKGAVVEKEGASWFVPNPKGDPKGGAGEDRESVLERSDGGRPTYFANDIAYHAEKYTRGFDVMVDVWGSNHHGHVSRIGAAMQVMGYDPKKIRTVLYQYVRVKRGEEVVKMSKRAGNFVTAREVLDEVGRDAFRFYLLMRSPESHLDFDLELAKKQSSENPVYYVQYAHARTASIFAKAKDEGISIGEWPPFKPVFCEVLNLPEEKILARWLLSYPDRVRLAATEAAPHRIAHFVLELARAFQAYYDRARGDERYRVVSTDRSRVEAKLFFIGCVRQVIRNALGLLGVTAPERM